MMSPTYWTASQIKAAAREHGWQFVTVEHPGGAQWGARKGTRRVMLQERRDGGLLAVWLHYPMYGGANCDYLGPRHAHKLEAVLGFLGGAPAPGERRPCPSS